MSSTEDALQPPKDATQSNDATLSDSLNRILQDQAEASTEAKHPSAERAVEILDDLKERIDLEILASLCHPNIVLTLTGARAQTEDYILRPTEEDRAALERVADILQEHGITLIIDNEVDTRTNDNAEILGFFVVDLAILARASRSTTIPGIISYDASTGVEGMQAWVKDCVRSLEKQSQEGHLDRRISKEDLVHIVVGIAKGYPDKAILSYLCNIDDSVTAEHIMSSDIDHADEYDCPQPNYLYGRELLNDPDVLSHQQMWGKLLADFYSSKWHEDIKTDPRYKELLTNQREGPG